MVVCLMMTPGSLTKGTLWHVNFMVKGSVMRSRRSLGEKALVSPFDRSTECASRMTMQSVSYLSVHKI